MNATRSRFPAQALLAGVLLAAALPAFAARDVMLVLDNSGSMKANDPARLAGPAVIEFIRNQPPDTRVGMVLFSADARLVMPLTPAEVAGDGAAREALAQFNYRGQWTQIAAGVERGLYELRNEGRPEARRVLVLMTDGLIDTGDALHDIELNKWLRDDLAAQAARDRIAIFGIAFTERADYQLLQSLAAATRAEYFRVLNASGLGKALERIESVLRANAAPAAPPPRPASPPPAAAATPAPSAQPSPQSADAAADAGPDGAEEAGSRAALWWVLSVLLLGAAGLGAWWYLHYRGGSAGGASRRDKGPTGVLYDAMERHEFGEKPVVIGRAGGHDPTREYIILPEKTVGRWHATIERRGQTFWLRDEGSVNGTFVNGERVQGERALKHRDQVRFHNHMFEFEIPELGDADRTVMYPT